VRRLPLRRLAGVLGTGRRAGTGRIGFQDWKLGRVDERLDRIGGSGVVFVLWG